MSIRNEMQKDANLILHWQSRVERIKEYVSANLAKDLDIATISQKFELSTTTFRHIFRNHQQQSYRHYVEDIRMDKALELLKEGKWIKETMAATGYKNRATFNNAFKKKFKYPASHFKK